MSWKKLSAFDFDAKIHPIIKKKFTVVLHLKGRNKIQHTSMESVSIR